MNDTAISPAAFEALINGNLESASISFPILGDSFVLDIKNYIEPFGLKIYLYGIFIALGFILATLYLLRRHNDFGLTQDNILDLFIYAVPSSLIGARLYYIIFNPSQYFGAGKWLNIFKLREGGLAVYGGIIFAALAVILYSRIKKVPFSKLADAGGIGLLIGQAIGRWGNFFNREAFGAQTGMPWRMGLTTPDATVYVHPTFLYESLWNITGFILLHFFSKKHKKYDGQLFLLYIAWYGFGRYMIEGLRIDSLKVQYSELRVSQLLAAISFCAASYILLRNHLRGVRVKDSGSDTAAAALEDVGEPLSAGAPETEETGGEPEEPAKPSGENGTLEN